MVVQIANAVIAALVGVICGLFFERRATRDARRRNAELEAELSVLRHSVLTMGAPAASGERPLEPVDLVEAVRQRALTTQNSEGRVQRSAVRTYFIALGHQATAIDDAVAQICADGLA